MDQVPGAPAFDPVGTQRGAEMRDVALDRVAGRSWRVFVPDLLDQLVQRDDAVGRRSRWASTSVGDPPAPPGGRRRSPRADPGAGTRGSRTLSPVSVAGLASHGGDGLGVRSILGFRGRSPRRAGASALRRSRPRTCAGARPPLDGLRASRRPRALRPRAARRRCRPALDALARDPGELARQRRGRLIPALLRETGSRNLR